MERPDLDTSISLTDFKEFYWLKEELIDFCKKVGINTIGSKIELTNIIAKYLETGELISFSKNKRTTKSNFDWNTQPLTKHTIITDSYKNTENVRRFFVKEIGSNFSFNVKFMAWFKGNEGKNLDDAIIEWRKIYDLKKDKNYVSEIGPQFEYNRYMRAFLSDNPNLSSKDAMKYWKLKRVRRGTNEYEQTDLELK